MKKLMKIMALAMSCAMVFGAVACGGNPPPPAGSVDYSVQFSQLDSNTTGTITIIKPDNELENNIINAAIAGFKAQYPKVTIEQRPLDIDRYSETIIRQNSIDELPDIIWCNSSNMYTLISQDIALNLDHLMEDATDAGVIDKDNDFTVEFNAMGKYKNVRYAVPRTADTIVTFYNKEIMADAGVDMTQYEDGWTWTQFLDVCEDLRDYFDGKDKTNFYPIQPNLAWESIAWPIVKSLGGQVIDANGNWEGVFTQAKAGEVYEFVHNLVEKDYIPDIEAGESSSSNFEAGDGPLLFQSTTIANFQKISSIKDKFDIVPFPLINGENSAIGSGFAGYALNKSLTENQNKLNIAGAFLAYMMSYDGQQKLAKDGLMTNPSIRADLGVDNPDAEWHKNYNANFNVGAYTWGGQYKVEMEFANNVTPENVGKVTGAMCSYVGAYCIRQTKIQAFNSYNVDMQMAFVG